VNSFIDLNNNSDLKNPINGAFYTVTDNRTARVVFYQAFPQDQSVTREQTQTVPWNIAYTPEEFRGNADLVIEIDISNAPSGTTIDTSGLPTGINGVAISQNGGVYEFTIENSATRDEIDLALQVSNLVVEPPNTFTGEFDFTVSYTDVAQASTKTATITATVNDIVLFASETQTEFYTVPGNTQNVSTNFEITTEAIDQFTGTIESTNPSVISNIQNSPVTAGTSSFDSNTKVFSFSGTRADCEIILNNILVTLNNDTTDFQLDYELLGDTGTEIGVVGDTATQQIFTTRYLSAPRGTAVYTPETATTIGTDLSTITDTAGSAGAYTLEIAAEEPTEVNTLSATGFEDIGNLNSIVLPPPVPTTWQLKEILQSRFANDGDIYYVWAKYDPGAGLKDRFVLERYDRSNVFDDVYNQGTLDRSFIEEDDDETYIVTLPNSISHWHEVYYATWTDNPPTINIFGPPENNSQFELKETVPISNPFGTVSGAISSLFWHHPNKFMLVTKYTNEFDTSTWRIIEKTRSTNEGPFTDQHTRDELHRPDFLTQLGTNAGQFIVNFLVENTFGGGTVPQPTKRYATNGQSGFDILQTFSGDRYDDAWSSTDGLSLIMLRDNDLHLFSRADGGSNFVLEETITIANLVLYQIVDILYSDDFTPTTGRITVKAYDKPDTEAEQVFILEYQNGAWTVAETRSFFLLDDRIANNRVVIDRYEQFQNDWSFNNSTKTLSITSNDKSQLNSAIDTVQLTTTAAATGSVQLNTTVTTPDTVTYTRQQQINRS